MRRRRTQLRTLNFLLIPIVAANFVGCAALAKNEGLVAGVDRPYNKFERAGEIFNEAGEAVLHSSLFVGLSAIGVAAKGIVEGVFESGLGRLYQPGENRSRERDSE